MALGAVATGSINAKLAASATGKASGCNGVSVAAATAATTGSMEVSVATLLASSDTRMVVTTSSATSPKAETPSSPAIQSPIQAARPVDSIAAASESPP